jgi:hypothetical protein
MMRCDNYNVGQTLNDEIWYNVWRILKDEIWYKIIKSLFEISIYLVFMIINLFFTIQSFIFYT